MSQNLTQPEEIDQALRDLEWFTMKKVPLASNAVHWSGTDQEDWRSPPTSPYRATYLKSHNMQFL